MTKHAAIIKANELWAHAGRYGCVTLRQKKNSPRFLVGHQKRPASVQDIAPFIIMGASDISWEDAFAHAAKCPCEGDYCTDPSCDMPEVKL